MDCLFCKILSGEIPADLVYESDTALAFRDINSKAPTHVLVIPRKHISTINDIEKDDELIIGSLYTAACGTRRHCGGRIPGSDELQRKCGAERVSHSPARYGRQVDGMAALAVGLSCLKPAF
jgi:hypothetical protein